MTPDYCCMHVSIAVVFALISTYRICSFDFCNDWKNLFAQNYKPVTIINCVHYINCYYTWSLKQIFLENFRILLLAYCHVSVS